jgi:hypothetical protein
MFIEVVRTPGESHELNSVGFGVVGLTRSHSLFRASASGSPGMVVVTFAELDDGVAPFFELHADSSRQLAIVTRDNFFKITYFNGSLLFESHLGSRWKPVALFVNKDNYEPALALFYARDVR